MTDMVEIVARAMWAENYQLHGSPNETTWNAVLLDEKELYCTFARAALTALMEPTDEMLKSGYSLYDDREAGQREIWQAMLKAALDD